MVFITIVNGVYKPTYNWGAPHCISLVSHLPWDDPLDPSVTWHPQTGLVDFRLPKCGIPIRQDR